AYSLNVLGSPCPRPASVPSLRGIIHKPAATQVSLTADTGARIVGCQPSQTGQRRGTETISREERNVTARLLGLQASIILGFALVSCGGSAAPAASSPAPSQAPASSPAAKPAGSESASAKPAASAAASASAKPAASPKPAPTTLPPIPADTTTVALTKVAIPPIAGKTLSADTLDVDQAAHVLYATDRTAGGIDVFDVSTPSAKYLTTIKTPAESHGITVAKDINRLFAGQPGSKLAIIDIDPKSPTVNTVIATVDTGGKLRADELAYDPKDKKVYISNI